MYQGIPWPWHTVRAQRHLTIIMSICIRSPAQRTGPQMSGRSEMVSWADSIMPRARLEVLWCDPQEPEHEAQTPWAVSGAPALVTYPVLPTPSPVPAPAWSSTPMGPRSLSVHTCLSVACPPTGMPQL